MHRIHALAAILSLLVISFANHPVSALEKTAALESFWRPLLFEPNTGQAPNAIQYLAQGPNYQVQLSPQGATLLIRDQAGCDTELTISLEGSLPQPALVGIRESSSKMHYFHGSDPTKWRTNVPAYGAVLYKDVYPGIDWMFYERDNSLEYDFLVAPGADPSQIRLTINGADRFDFNEHGDISIHTENGSLEMLSPVAFQESDPVKATYIRRSESKIEFALGSYDAEKSLTIDPVLSFGTFLGGNTYDTISDVGVDNAGNFYAVGYTEANTRFPGFGDGVIYKFNPAGSLVWSAFLIGSGGDSAEGIAVAPNGTSYIVGATNSRDFPIVGGFQTQNGGGNDAFVVKLPPNGQAILRSSYLGGNGNDGASAIVLGSGPKLGNELFITGHTDSRNFPLTNPTQNKFGGGRQDGFLTVVHSIQFQKVMSTYVGYDGGDEITSIALNKARGDLYVPALALDGRQGNYIAHFKPASPASGPANSLLPLIRWVLAEAAYLGTVQGIKYLRVQNNCDSGGIGLCIFAIGKQLTTTNPRSTAVDENGSLLITDAELNVVNTVGFGGPGPGAYFVNDMVVDKGAVYLVGETVIKNLPTVNAFQAKSKGSTEGFVLVLAPGTYQPRLYSYLGGAGADYPQAVAVSKDGSIVVAGSTSSKKFPTTVGALDRTLNGTTDGFAVKITP